MNNERLRSRILINVDDDDCDAMNELDLVWCNLRTQNERRILFNLSIEFANDAIVKIMKINK